MRRGPLPADTEVAKRRAGRGLTQAELAKVAGITRPMLSLIENGWVPLTAVRKRIAAVLDTTEDILWPQLFTDEYASYGRKS